MDLTNFTCPNEFTSIFVQGSLILTLGAEGNRIRNLKKINRELPFILPPVMVPDKQILVAGESHNGLNGPFYALLPWKC